MYSYVGQVFVTQKQVRVGNFFKGLLHVTLYNQYQTEGYEFQNLYCPSRTISKHQPLSWSGLFYFFLVLKTLQPMHDEWQKSDTYAD